MIDLKTAKPREIEGYLREVVRKNFGDSVENASDITSSHGFYHVTVVLKGNRFATFNNFRRGEVPQIVKALRAIAK